MRPGIHAALTIGAVLLAAGAQAQDDETNPPVEAPKPAPTPAPTPRPKVAPKASDTRQTPIAASRTRSQASRPSYTSRYGSLSSSNNPVSQEFLALKRSARNKTYIPTLMQNALEWSRVSPTTKSSWDRKGGWSEKPKWDAPSTWKGASLDKTATSLTSTRSPGLSYAERHPLVSAYGPRKTRR